MATSNNHPPKDLMGMLDYYLVKKSPVQLPVKAKEWIVKYGPWIDLVLLLLILPGLLFLLGLGAIVLPMSTVAGHSGFGFPMIFLLAQIALMVFALPGLFARKKQGWDLSFYGVILGLVYSLINFNILGGFVNALIGLYLLFQIRSYYR